MFGDHDTGRDIFFLLFHCKTMILQTFINLPISTKDFLPKDIYANLPNSIMDFSLTCTVNSSAEVTSFTGAGLDLTVI